ncbi:MAG: hypothetical protein FWH22_09960 [Fibromonadales bacterium]|nr:hypothetical protein [Fibromonadales bacterium]
MKKIILLLALLLSISFAQNGALGFWFQGGNSGENWGLDYKHLSSSVAHNIYATIKSSGGVLSTGAYYGHYFQYNIIKADASVGRFPLYWGPVGGFGYWGGNNVNGFALRGGVTGGISWMLPSSFPMDISAELNPVAEIHHVSWPGDSDTNLEFPRFYFRLLFHAYFF